MNIPNHFIDFRKSLEKAIPSCYNYNQRNYMFSISNSFLDDLCLGEITLVNTYSAQDHIS